MDVFQGVNTEEQVQLLKLIQYNNATKKKNLPVIVVCTKVDDFHNQEILMLVEEVRAKVHEVFPASFMISQPTFCAFPKDLRKLLN